VAHDDAGTPLPACGTADTSDALHDDLAAPKDAAAEIVPQSDTQSVTK
jgi:hypothetical protein